MELKFIKLEKREGGRPSIFWQDAHIIFSGTSKLTHLFRNDLIHRKSLYNASFVSTCCSLCLAIPVYVYYMNSSNEAA